MAIISQTSESRVFDTTLAAFPGDWIQGLPVEQKQVKNRLLTAMLKKKKSAPAGRMYANVAEITTEDGEGWFNKAEELTPTDIDDVTTAYYDVKLLRTKVTVFYADLIKNPGKAFFKLVAWKLSRGRTRHLNLLQSAVWATSQVSKGLTGVPLAVKDDPTTGTYGGINSANLTSWRNKYDSTGYTISTGLMGAIDAMDYELEQEWDFAFTSDVVHRIMRQYHRDFASINLTPSSPMGKRAADLGFAVIEYDGKPIMWDRDCPKTSATTGHRFYFFTRDNFYLGVVPGWYMRQTPWTELESQEGKTCTIITACQCVTTKRRTQGVIKNLDV